MEDTLKETLRRLEEQLQTASIRADAGLLAELLSDDFREIGTSGRVYTKPAILAALAVESPVHFIMTEFEAAPLAEGVVLVTYRTVKQSAGTTEIVSLRSSVWLFQDGRWRMRFHQGTRV